ncbi:hypothetical protein C943_01797 [Mariniradius saccharolyticus AK6]|uniref:Uncharacterized protein n=1 Tax=Mariniradius saccharolyticus AK6 TaxID=1239962 RepID=M7XB64_9BACT|nr:hypothetical protein C943_01797 [Mariniradius saccharolyticus AK6]
MFTLFMNSPRFPKVKPVNLKFVQSYIQKFEESLKVYEELQKESAR